MSSGPFQTVAYGGDDTTVYPIKVQPETLALSIGGTANDAPAGPINGKVYARVGGSHRSYGVHARNVRVKFTGTPPTGYKADSVIKLPWLALGTFGGLTAGQTGTYLGASIILVGKTPEYRR